jgi:predicted phosphodiesterase
MLKKILIITDSHHPFVDKKAWNLMLAAATGFKPDYLVIGGDFGDCLDISDHDKNPKRRLQFESEVLAVRKALKEVIAINPKAKRHFIEGNHEDRLRRYLWKRSPELVDQISIEKLYQLEKLKFTFTPYKSTLRIGKLSITHDLGNAGRHAHYKALDTAQTNVVINHTHRIGYAVEGSSDGRRHVTAMFGWLGDLAEVDYMHADKARKDWSLGFGTGYLDTKTGYVYLVPIPIVEGTCVVEGKLYK